MRPGARGEEDLLAVEQVLQVRVEGHLPDQAARAGPSTNGRHAFIATRSPCTLDNVLPKALLVPGSTAQARTNAARGERVLLTFKAVPNPCMVICLI